MENTKEKKVRKQRKLKPKPEVTTVETKPEVKPEVTLIDKAINIKGKQYVLVSDRILYFNENYTNGCINTEMITNPENPNIIIKATVMPDIKNPLRTFTGYSQATIGDGYINKTSALENAETSAVGRALGLMGIGVIESIASADEMNKALNSNGTKTQQAKPEAKPDEEVNPDKVREYADLLQKATTMQELVGLVKQIPTIYQNEKFIKFVKEQRDRINKKDDAINNAVVTRFDDFSNRVKSCKSDIDLFEMETELEAGGYTDEEIKAGKELIAKKSKTLP